MQAFLQARIRYSFDYGIQASLLHMLFQFFKSRVASRSLVHHWLVYTLGTQDLVGPNVDPFHWLFTHFVVFLKSSTHCLVMWNETNYIDSVIQQTLFEHPIQ